MFGCAGSFEVVSVLVCVDWMMLCLLVMCMVWHFCGWKCIANVASSLTCLINYQDISRSIKIGFLC